MKILVENEQESCSVSAELEDQIKRIMEECLHYEDFHPCVEISLTFVNNEKIREINKEFRNIDKETDVLSFPMLEFEERYEVKEGEFRKKLILNEEEKFDYSEENLLLGDVILSLEKALEQSLEYGHSYEREVAFLICHSMFHLMGYDHIKEEDAKIMRKKEEDVLSSLGYKR